MCVCCVTSCVSWLCVLCVCVSLCVRGCGSWLCLDAPRSVVFSLLDCVILCVRRHRAHRGLPAQRQTVRVRARDDCRDPGVVAVLPGRGRERDPADVGTVEPQRRQVLWPGDREGVDDAEELVTPAVHAFSAACWCVHAGVCACVCWRGIPVLWVALDSVLRLGAWLSWFAVLSKHPKSGFGSMGCCCLLTAWLRDGILVAVLCIPVAVAVSGVGVSIYYSQS